ncbi:MAG: hypothetical protein GY838_02070 [bacterium]|nr:hypothetical protein [bacterium]
MGSKLAKGVGIGCGVLALVFVALAGGGVWFARTMQENFASVAATEEKLLAAHGEAGAWAPAAALVPASERVAAFVRVRSATAEWRSHLGRSAARWRIIQSTSNPVLRLVRGLRAGGEAGETFAGFWTARNEALLAEGMGPQEYAWLYHLVYHGWFGHDPAAGAGDADIELGRGVGVGVSRNQAATQGNAARARDMARDRTRRSVTAMLERAPAAGEAAAWREQELARLAADPERWPWRTDLPAAFGAAFAPYETELAAAWSAAANPMELLFEALETQAPEAGD